VYHTMYSRVMEDQSRQLSFVPKCSSRTTRKAKRALIKEVKEAFSRLAVGAAENIGLALAVASVKAELGADGQQEDAAGGEAAETLERWYWLGHWGPSKMLRWLSLLRLKRKYAVFAWVAFLRCESR